MQLNLVPHPVTPPSDPAFKVWATVDYAAAFGAPIARFVIPDASEPGRSDNLWQTTCFEAFLKAEGMEAYREWNFAPSGSWAAYDFSAYRQGMAPADVEAPPYIRLEDSLTWWTFGATIAVEADRSWRLGLSAVLEEKDGTKSYWALAHAGEKPDFHHVDCFAARLA